MTKPLVTIELDEYNKLIEQSKSISKLLDDLGITLNIVEYPSYINTFDLLYDVTIEKRKLKHYLIKKYNYVNILNVKFKEVEL